MYHIFWNTLSLYEVFAYFFVYSFLGWVVEVAFHAVTMGKFVNRGFLNGPVCPIYGTGVVIMLLILGDSVSKPWLVFLLGVIFPTLIELITGWAMETFSHNKWWDYSDRKFNFKGYICLEFAILWGLAVLLVLSVIHPFIEKLVAIPSETVGTVLVCVFWAIMIADLVVTVLQVLKLNERLKEIDEAAKAMRVGSELIGKQVAAATLTAQKGLTAAKAGIAEAKEGASEKLNGVKEAVSIKWNEKLLSLVRRCPKRLLKAFPALTSRRNPDSVPLVKEGMKELKKNR